MPDPTPRPAGSSGLSKEIPMSAEQFRKLRDIIYQRAGITFTESKKYVLESRLCRRLQELEIDDYDQYIAFLSTGPYQGDEFNELFNKITINETSFFRNPPQLDAFEKETLAGLLAARASHKRLRVWSAACSSGEEPYTLAMQVHRTLGLRLGDWKIEILGTDISERVLEIAQGGRYTDYAMRGLPPLVQQRYFRKDGHEWVIDPAVAALVRFEELNLKDRLAIKRLGQFDVIFCRNVMIYFDDPMRKQLVSMFHEALAADGTLYIGHSETLRDLGVPFAQVGPATAFSYRKLARAGSGEAPLGAGTAPGAPTPARPGSKAA
ncbi:MAG: chemotaxis protein [Isosphaera sp.]|nr:chemotaxis protein [Isosphaera sp.]